MLDFFGSGCDASAKIGLLTDLEHIHYPIARLKFVGEGGYERLSLPYPMLRKRLFQDRHFNFMRGDLEGVLFKKIAGSTEVRFGTTIDAFDSAGTGLHVRLSDGSTHDVDLLVGADGVHSKVRRLAFGEEPQFARFVGCYTAAFIIPRHPQAFGVMDSFVTLTVPGRQVAVYPIRGGALAAFFVHRSARHRDVFSREGVLHELRDAYGHMGWLVPELLEEAARVPNIAILGGSSSVVIMPAMQYARLEPTLSNLVNLESALTDVLCVVVSGALITTLSGGTTELGGAASSLGKSFAIGIGVGAVAGFLWILLHRLWQGSDHEYPVTLGALLVIYVVIGSAGGSAALGILTAAVLIGNAAGISRKLGMAEPARLDPRLQDFHRHVTFMIKSFFFTFIGMMLGPPWTLMGLGAVLGVALFLSRYPAVRLAMSGKAFRSQERGLIWVALPRGMAAGVLAMMPHQAGVPATESLPTVVFAAVVTTIFTFAIGFPLMKRRLLPIPRSGAAPLDEAAALRVADSSVSIEGASAGPRGH